MMTTPGPVDIASILMVVLSLVVATLMSAVVVSAIVTSTAAVVIAASIVVSVPALIPRPVLSVLLLLLGVMGDDVVKRHRQHLVSVKRLGCGLVGVHAG